MLRSSVLAVTAASLMFALLNGCKPSGGGCPTMPSAVTSPAPSAAVTTVVAQPSAPAAPAGIVDVMTGKANMDAGRRAAQKIRAVSRQERQDLDNALAP